MEFLVWLLEISVLVTLGWSIVFGYIYFSMDPKKEEVIYFCPSQVREEGRIISVNFTDMNVIITSNDLDGDIKTRITSSFLFMEEVVKFGYELIGYGEF